MYIDNVLVGDGILDDRLFKLHLNFTLNCILTTMHNNNVSIKLGVINEKSSMLWNRRLCHISIDRIMRLINDGVLEACAFTDFTTCVDCIKGKRTNKSNKGAKRTSDVLEIIHIEISGPYDTCFNGQRYFITFINDYT